MLDHDYGEQMAASQERAIGTRLVGCPWRQLRDPFVLAVMNAHRWKKDGELDTRFGHRPIPEALRRGLDVYEPAVNAIENYDRKQEREQREAERKQREAEDRIGRGPTGGGRRRR